MATTTDTPKIWVACLSSYNNGHLHGAWIDASDEPDIIWLNIKRMLERCQRVATGGLSPTAQTSPEEDAEEWALHDHEGFYGYRLGECPSIEKVSLLAQGIAKHGGAYTAYVMWMEETSDSTPTLVHFEEVYRGKWESEENFAVASDEVGDRYDYDSLPEFWKQSIDWESVALHIFMEDYQAIKVSNGSRDRHLCL